jgi:Universal stress protein family.
MLRKILVALDGGPTSYDALNTAIELTQKDHGELILMSVVNTVNLPVNFGVSFNPDLADDLQNDSEMNLMLAKKILKINIWTIIHVCYMVIQLWRS